MASALISIRVEGDKIEIVDQLLLPHVTRYIEINSPEDAHDAIKTMKVGMLSMGMNLPGSN
jgi:methylthioribose-1-phosphate isomerase